MVNKAAKGHYRWEDLEPVKRKVAEVRSFDQLGPEFVQDKTLACMTFSFISLVRSKGTISLERAGQVLSNNNILHLKSKTRRLYDICKVLAAIGLISTSQDTKRAIIVKWLGPGNIQRVLQPLLVSKNVKLKIDKQNFKAQKMRSSLLKNITKILDEKYKITTKDLLSKRRTSSFDITVMDKFLKKNNTIILPKVNLPSINLNQ